MLNTNNCLSCLSCHGITHKIVGPGYQAVDAKYKGDAQAPSKPEGSIRKGSVGTLGASADADVCQLDQRSGHGAGRVRVETVTWPDLNSEIAYLSGPRFLFAAERLLLASQSSGIAR